MDVAWQDSLLATSFTIGHYSASPNQSPGVAGLGRKPNRDLPPILCTSALPTWPQPLPLRRLCTSHV